MDALLFVPPAGHPMPSVSPPSPTQQSVFVRFLRVDQPRSPCIFLPQSAVHARLSRPFSSRTCRSSLCLPENRITPIRPSPSPRRGPPLTQAGSTNPSLVLRPRLFAILLPRALCSWHSILVPLAGKFEQLRPSYSMGRRRFDFTASVCDIASAHASPPHQERRIDQLCATPGQSVA